MCVCVCLYVFFIDGATLVFFPRVLDLFFVFFYFVPMVNHYQTTICENMCWNFFQTSKSRMDIWHLQIGMFVELPRWCPWNGAILSSFRFNRAGKRARLPGCFKEAEPWAVVGAQAMGLMGNQKFDDLIFLKLWNISRPKNTVNDSQAKSKKGQPSGDRWHRYIHSDIFIC